MELITFRREQDEYRRHLERVRDCNPLINNKTPESLNLHHLKSRAKKSQLKEDRMLMIAMENKKLMLNMTKILSDPRKQQAHVKTASKNESARKQSVDRINRDNKAMVARLESMPPIISASKLDEDYEKHLQVSTTLRKRHNMLLSLRRDSRSPAKVPTKGGNASTTIYNSNAKPMHSDTPIRTIAEFRAQVIGKKKAEGRPELRSSMDILSQFEGVPFTSSAPSNIRFELTNNPSGYLT